MLCVAALVVVDMPVCTKKRIRRAGHEGTATSSAEPDDGVQAGTNAAGAELPTERVAPGGEPPKPSPPRSSTGKPSIFGASPGN